MIFMGKFYNLLFVCSAFREQMKMNETAHSTIEPILISRREVERLTTLCRSSIYALIQKDRFPRPVRIADQRVAWVKQEVTAWVNDRIANARV